FWAASHGPTARQVHVSPGQAYPGQASPRQALPGETAAHCQLTPPPIPGGEPLQTHVPPSMAPFRHNQFTVTPLAGFSIEARVLGREDYR
ncbi:MAG: hypothetical protein ACK4UX_13395, partial [Thiobacillus sp.]